MVVVFRPFFQGEVSSPYPLLCWTPWRPSGPKPRKAVLKRRSPITFPAGACKNLAPQHQSFRGSLWVYFGRLGAGLRCLSAAPPGFWPQGGWASQFEPSILEAQSSNFGTQPSNHGAQAATFRAQPSNLEAQTSNLKAQPSKRCQPPKAAPPRPTARKTLSAEGAIGGLARHV